jgi:hypothetical protein
MLYIRRIGQVLVAAAITSALTTSVAWASAPEFSPGTLNKFTGLAGLVQLATSSTKPVDCTSSTATGEITGTKQVGSVQITFSGCSSTEGSGCTVSGSGAGTGKIVTNTLDGELGSVKATEAESGVGLLILPTSGTVFATLEGSCLLISPSPIDGSVAAEVSPTTAVEETVDELDFEGANGKQSIKEINVLGSTVKPKLLAFGLLEASAATSEEALFSTSVKIVGAVGPTIELKKPEAGKDLKLLVNGGTKGVVEYKNADALGGQNWRPTRSRFATQSNGFSEVLFSNKCVNHVIGPQGTCTVEIEFTLGMAGVLNEFKTRPDAPPVDLESIT